MLAGSPMWTKIRQSVRTDAEQSSVTQFSTQGTFMSMCNMLLLLHIYCIYLHIIMSANNRNMQNISESECIKLVTIVSPEENK